MASGPVARTRPIAPGPGTTGSSSKYLRAPLKTSVPLAAAHSALRLTVPFATCDRLMATDIEAAAVAMRRSEVLSPAQHLLPSFR